MKSRFLESTETYDGSQLVSLRNYLRHGLLGDSVVAWIGPCEVEADHMVDGEDPLAGSEIRGEKMLHFIVELFDSTLFAAVGIQRLMAAIAKDVLEQVSMEKKLTCDLRREGDDIFAGDRKFSISIATQSPTSSLIHFAVNVVNRGTPVPTISLEEFGLDAKLFATEVMERLTAEVESIRQATRKVKWVR